VIDLRDVTRARLDGAWKRAGKYLRGPCPLCKTSKQSQAFAVSDGGWHCFACHEKGGIRDFYEKILHERPPFREKTTAAYRQDERTRQQIRDLEVFGHRVASARMLDAIRRKLKTLGPDDLDAVWDLRELEEAIEACIDDMGSFREAHWPKILRMYLDRMESDAKAAKAKEAKAVASQ